MSICQHKYFVSIDRNDEKREYTIMSTPFVQQLRTGKVKRLGDEHAKDPMERSWETGMFKKERVGEIYLTKTGLQDDEVADTKVHGGPEKALFAYPVHHYEYWRTHLPVTEIDAGAMGENLVLTGVA